MPLPRRSHGQSQHPPSLWRNRDYLLLWSGQTVSAVGTEVSNLAFPLLFLALTGSPAQAGFAAALRSVPYLIFGLPAGALVDRWNRKRTMILCDLGRALAVGSIPIAYEFRHLALPHLYLVAFVESSLAVFFTLAETAALPNVVPQALLPRATAQNNTALGVTALIGPPLGGTLYAVGRMLPFVTDAISYVCSVIGLLFVRGGFQQARPLPRRSVRTEIGEGLGWLWGQPLIRAMALLTAGLRFTRGEALILIVLAQRQGASSRTFGVIFAAGGIGTILGSLWSPVIQRRFSFGRAISGACWWLALSFLLYAAVPKPLALGAIFALRSLVPPVYDTVQVSYRLALIPDVLQERVNSVFRLMTSSLQPIVLALTGWLLQVAGGTVTILLFGGWFVMLALAATLNPHVRTAPPRAESQ